MPDSIAALEALVAKSKAGKYVLRLYVTGTTPHSTRAIANIRKTCDRFLNGRYELTVIDLLNDPGKAREEGIIAAPTLVKSLPAPLRKLIGDLADERRVLIALDIPTTEEP